MCIVSAIGDDWQRRLPQQWPLVPPNPVYPIPEISRSEFDALKREVEALKVLLKQAKKFDEETGQPNCEVEQKVAFMKQIAEALGVDMSDVFPQPL
jgi:hypothetical protein